MGSSLLYNEIVPHWSDRALLRDVVPHWDRVLDFIVGQIRAYDYRRQRRVRTSGRSETNGMSQRYSFDDAHRVVGDLTESFGSFWESECASMKEVLL